MPRRGVMLSSSSKKMIVGEVWRAFSKILRTAFSDSPTHFESNSGPLTRMKFDSDCPLPELIKTVPHVAFVVDDIEAAIAGKEILIAPNSPAEGVTVAFVVDDGAPIEFLQFDRPEAEIWPENAKFRIIQPE